MRSKKFRDRLGVVPRWSHFQRNSGRSPRLWALSSEPRIRSTHHRSRLTPKKARDMGEEQHEFHLEEFKQLKGEIAVLLGRIDTLARYALLVAATVFSWLTTQGIGVAPDGAWCNKVPLRIFRQAWWIPLAFSALSGMAAVLALCRAMQMGAYIKKIEQRMAAHGLGWEHSLEKKTSVLTLAGVVFWAILFLATGLVAWRADLVLDEVKTVCPGSDGRGSSDRARVDGPKKTEQEGAARGRIETPSVEAKQSGTAQ